jgi:hypothetical protein
MLRETITVYKFSFVPDDDQLNTILDEVTENFATNDDISGKADTVSEVNQEVPQLEAMTDGQFKYYYDGTNYWQYVRLSGKLFRHQLTEVT